jgi:hypothetical protein
MQKKAFELSRVSGQPVSDAELLDDLRRVAASLTVSVHYGANISCSTAST